MLPHDESADARRCAPVRLGRARRAARPQRRRHDLSALAAPARRLSRQADRPAGALGRRRARPRASWPQRDDGGAWRTHHLRAGAAQRARASAQALLDAQSLRRAADRRSCPATISSTRCSGSRAMYVGIPYAPISPAYSLISQRLRQAAPHRRPADAGPRVRRRRQAYRARDRGRRAAGRRDRRDAQSARRPRDAVRRPARGDADRRGRRRARQGRARHHRQVPVHLGLDRHAQGRDQHAAHVVRQPGDDRAQRLPFFADEPPVLVDWAPWNHTSGGNHDVGLVLYNGGTLYIDDGKPLPGAIEETVRNLREIAPTWYFNVPKGYEALLPYLPRRRGAARELLQPPEGAVVRRRRPGAAGVRRDAGAGRTATCGERILFLTGLGSTETAPFALGRTWDDGERRQHRPAARRASS